MLIQMAMAFLMVGKSITDLTLLMVAMLTAIQMAMV
jgi:hypothetical protein